MTTAFAFVLGALSIAFVGAIFRLFWHPRCEECQRKAMPHISLALIRESHRADRADEVLRFVSRQLGWDGPSNAYVIRARQAIDKHLDRYNAASSTRQEGK